MTNHKHHTLLFATASLLMAACLGCTADALTYNFAIKPSKTVWFDAPASIWEECLPMGDGRLGIMADGAINHENIVLNEITMWSGTEFDYSNPEAAKSLPKIQQLLLEGKNLEAQQLMYEHFVPKKSENGGTYGTYQILANLNIDYTYPDTLDQVTNYRRVLDLDSGTSLTEFTAPDGTTYKRFYAVPRGQDCILIKLGASKPNSINFTYRLSRPERAQNISCADSVIMLAGHLDSGIDSVDGIEFAVGSKAKALGKNAKVRIIGDSIVSVADADEAWIAISAATSYAYGDSAIQSTINMIDNALINPMQTLSEGIKQHKELMGRVELNLHAEAHASMPTPQRIERFTIADNDAALAALYFNYGRYLLISSTRQDLLPPNLQGLWANTIQTPWNGDYHTNINVQMNHWPAEPTNLSELHLPLFDLLKRAIPSGERSAKAFYGDNAQGWVMHMMTNVWNYTEPGEHPSWGATNTGGAWICHHLWEHYLYTGDKQFLAEAYPIMQGAARFFLSTMIEEPSHNYLVTAPSSSPENAFYVHPDDSIAVSVCMGPTMDTQIISELWQNVIKSAEIIGKDDPLTDSLKTALAKLPPMQIDSEGRLMEWLCEYKEHDRQHRHISHLYGLYPAQLISPFTTPELAKAALNTLNVRGDEGTGWSRAWKINFHARLLDGNRAWSVFKGLLQPAIDPTTKGHRAGTFPNLFCSHAPFQIDGNFGATAGIAQMFIQSHENLDDPENSFISILPALPSRFRLGSLKGFKTIGGHTISMKWDNYLTKEIVIEPGFQQKITLKLPEGVKRVVDNHKHTYTPDSQGFITIENTGETITLKV